MNKIVSNATDVDAEPILGSFSSFITGRIFGIAVLKRRLELVIQHKKSLKIEREKKEKKNKRKVW